MNRRRTDSATGLLCEVSGTTAVVWSILGWVLRLLEFSFWPSASFINDLGAQHFVPDFRHLNISVISALPRPLGLEFCHKAFTYLRKQVKLRYDTMHDPGHSFLGSIVVVVVVRGGWCGRGFGFDTVTAALVLSQQTDPLLQFKVWGIRTDGLWQNAAIMLRRQKPGQPGPGSGVVGLGLVVVIVSSLG